MASFGTVKLDANSFYSSLMKLPGDIILSIFSMLSREQLTSCSKVCTRWVLPFCFFMKILNDQKKKEKKIIVAVKNS
jgi:hypothetical protein